MKRFVVLVALVLAVASCSADDGGSTTTADDGGSTTTNAGTSTTDTSTTDTSGAEVIPPQLDGWEIEDVQVGDRTMRLAIADSPTLRAQGLMEVTDLGDLDGMLFYWRHEAHGGFHMENTVIPLDIVWFLEDGTYADRTSMLPCEVEDCPIYTPRGGVDYRYAIEANPGDLDWIDESTVIVYSD